MIAAGGTQVVPEEAVKTGIDQGFGRDSHGIDVATFLVEEGRRRRGEKTFEQIQREKEAEEQA